MQKEVALCLLYCLNGEVRFRKWFTKRACAYARAQEMRNIRNWYANANTRYPKIERRPEFLLDLRHALPVKCNESIDAASFTIVKLQLKCGVCGIYHLDYRSKLWKKYIL